MKLKFREYRTRFDYKHLLFLHYYCLWGHPFMTFLKKWPTNDLPSPSSTICKNEQIYCLKKIESAKTWQISNISTPFCVDVINICFFSGFFKVWSVTCLNTNEILNYMKIQSGYLLLSYQRNQAHISHYISCFFSNFLASYVSNHYVCLVFVTRFYFWNVIDGNVKLT